MTAEGNNSANRSTELDRLERKAAAGFSDAMFDLGIRYSLGNKGLTYDEDKAVDLIVRSAKSGYAPATKWISDNARSNVYIAVKCQDRIQTNGAVKDSNTRNDRDSRKPVKSGKTRGKNPQHAPTNPGSQSYSTVYEKALSLVKSKKTEEGKELMKYAASNGNNNARIWIKLEAEKGDSELIGWIEGEADNGNQWAFNWISKRANLNDERSVNWIYRDADRSRTRSVSKSQSMKWVMNAAHYGNKRAFQWIASNAEGHDADCVKWFVHEARSNNPSALNWILKNAGNDDTRFFNIIKERADEGDRECILWLQRAAHFNREAFNWVITKAITGDSRSMRWLQTEAECNDVLFDWMCDKACEGHENTFNWMCDKAKKRGHEGIHPAKSESGRGRCQIIHHHRQDICHRQQMRSAIPRSSGEILLQSLYKRSGDHLLPRPVPCGGCAG